MADHFEEEVQVERLKAWWRDNWKSLAAGLGLGAVAVVGWEGYDRYHTDQAEKASAVFEQLQAAQAAGKSDEARVLGGQLTRDFARTPYATGAAFFMAQTAAGQGQWADAKTHLQWALDHAQDDATRDLARLRLARVLWQLQEFETALKQLEGEHPGYEALFAELKGDIKLAQNDRAAARRAYEEALGKSEGPNRELLQRKLDDVADAVKS